MKAYRTEKEIADDGVLHLDALPFRAGERVEVVILSSDEGAPADPTSVHGKVLEYTNPTEPVANREWDAVQ